MDPRSLPVYAERARIIETLKDNPVIVVESPTGSGKTTQLPIILEEAGYSQKGIIGITQPRRIAAVSVSDYISRQLSEKPSGFAAYKMRFEDHTDRNTRIKIMTDGILLQELKADPWLANYSVIMVDEAHERSLTIDFILGLLKRILEERKDFRVIVSSATINAEVFSQYFHSCPVVRIETKTYPVQTVYAPPAVPDDPDALEDKLIDIVEHTVSEEQEGDILVFLSGEKQIKDAITRIHSQPWSKKLHIVPLYGRLSKEEQDLVFPKPPKGKRKLIVSTNIAETSITIDGVRIIIDSGLAKMNYYSPRTYTSSLVERPISRASANQRQGRAGRTGPGTCYRLYSKQDYDARPLFTQEEIYRTDLSEVVLRMSELGIRDFASFDFISSPGRQGISAAVETLQLLDALTPDNELSEIGKMMAWFPLLPKHSRILVEGIRNYPSVLEELAIATAFLTTSHPFLLPQGEELAARRAHHKFREPGGDFMSYLRIYESYIAAPDKEKFCEQSYLEFQAMEEIVNVKTQLCQIVSDMGIPVSSGGKTADFLKGIARGLIQFVCVRSGKYDYRSLTADHIEIHPGSVLFRENPDFIVAGEIVKTSRTYARSVSPLSADWLSDISPELERAFRSSKDAGGSGRKDRTGAKGEKSGKRSEPALKSTQTSLGGRIYNLEIVKGGRKLIILNWEEVRKLTSNTNFQLQAPQAGLAASIRYGKYRMFHMETLGTVLRLSKHFSPEKDILRGGKKVDLRLDESPADIAKQLRTLGKMVPLRKKSPELGFLALYSNGKGGYWIKPSASISECVSESLASLESLADDMTTQSQEEFARAFSSRFRWLNLLLEDL